MEEPLSTNVILDTLEKFNAWKEGLDSWNQWVRDQPDRGINEVDGKFELTLRGNAAVNLWLCGKDAWNEWADANPDANVDFSHMEFEPNDGHRISFEDFNFPVGKGEVSFAKCKFAHVYVVFTNAHLGGGSISFYDANFGNGPLVFADTVFGDGDVNFAYANVDDGVTTFSGSSYGKGRVEFRNSSFGGPVRFLNLKDTAQCALFSFEGARFEQLFSLSLEDRLGCPLDLRRTSLSHNVIVSDIDCDFAVEPLPRWADFLQTLFSSKPTRWRWTTRAIDREDTQRFCRLKELALSNRNYAKALDFHAKEIQSRKGHETIWWQDAIQFIFWLLGGYGRSAKRPFAAIAVSLFLFASLFWNFRVPINEMERILPEDQWKYFSRDFLDALTYSGSHLLAFIPVGRTARSQGEVALFAGETPNYILILGATESIAGVLLLFMLGLSLRNLFRV